MLIPLGSYFTDDDGDVLILTATSSFNAGAATTLPAGIFTVPSSFNINVSSLGLADVGSYLISLTISDSQISITSSFTLTITNAAPRLLATIADMTGYQNQNTLADMTASFVDDDGDPITMSATYTFNAGAVTTIPGGIFTVPTPFKINAFPTIPT
jgi:hypothetical protein